MPYIVDHNQKFEELRIRIDNQDELKRQANGGNSILFCYQPDEEYLYINKAQELFQGRAMFIDVSQLFVKFINEDGWDSFKEYYLDFQNTPHLVFRSDDPETDLFDMIIKEIEIACNNSKIPFLVRTGSLYGTGIENVNIMEHRTVMNLPHPLVIFYPSIIEDDNLFFLNFKLASKYRCILVK